MQQNDQGSQIRDATEADAGSIAEVYNLHVTGGVATMDDEGWTEESVRQRMQGFGPRELFLVLAKGPDIAGWGILKKYSDRLGYRFCGETAVYLRRRHLGKKFGQKIKLALIERCRQLDYHHLVARIFAQNQASIEYNLKLGYELVGRQREIGFKDGRWVDVVILQLVLDEVEPDPS